MVQNSFDFEVERQTKEIQKRNLFSVFIYFINLDSRIHVNMIFKKQVNIGS